MKIMKHITQHIETVYYSVLQFIRTIEFNFDIRKNVLFSQRLLRKHRRFLCPPDTKQQSWQSKYLSVMTLQNANFAKSR